MKKRYMSLFAAAVMTLSSPAQAGDAKVVVELFTSQGCSSCPPADAMLGDLARKDGVIALAYHVDYWDYLGWKDTFARNAFTKRQQSYVGHTDRQWLSQRMRGPFTPEIVVQGVDSMVGHDSQAIMARVYAHKEAMPPAKVVLSANGGGLDVNLTTPEPLGRLLVMVAEYAPSREVAITRGENAGRTLTYHHVVTQLRQVGEWNGSDTYAISIEQIELPVVVFVQKGPAGPILAAAELR